MSAMPGGIIEMVLLGEELKANVAKITLVQASRMFFLVLTLPFIIQYIFQIDISGNQIITEPISNLSLSDIAFLIAIGIVGAIFGKAVANACSLSHWSNDHQSAGFLYRSY